MKVWIDRDSYFLFYQTDEPVYGRAPVDLPQEIIARLNNAIEELNQVQMIVGKAWHEAQYDGQLGELKAED